MVSLLTLLSVASTVAGILSTVDFQNNLLGHLGRAGIIGGAGLAGAAAYRLLARGR